MQFIKEPSTQIDLIKIIKQKLRLKIIHRAKFP